MLLSQIRGPLLSEKVKKLKNENADVTDFITPV